VIKPHATNEEATNKMNTERNLRIASKPHAAPFALYRSSFWGLSHWACYTVFYGAFEPLKLLDFYRPQDIFNPLLYRLSYRARGGIVTGKNWVSGSCCDPLRAPASRTVIRLLDREHAPAMLAAHRPHTKTGLNMGSASGKSLWLFDTHRS